MKNILVTGATGFLGSRVVEALARNKEVNTIIATGRTLKKSHTVQHPTISYQLGDLTAAKQVEKLVKQVNVIINCAALSSPWGKYDDFYLANVVTQEHLINYALQQNIARFIHISTPSIYYTGKDRFDIKETDPLPKKMVNHYAQTKLIAEQRLLNSTLKSIILRPRALTGRGDRVIMPRLIRAMKEGKLRIIGSGKNIVDLTAVKNVVHAIELALQAKLSTACGIYNISNGEPVELWTMISYVLKGIGLTPPTQRLSKNAAMAIAHLLTFLSKLTPTAKEPALLPYSVGSLSTSLTMNIDAAKQKLGYQPIQTTKESIDEFIDWYNFNS